eukprot:5152241-Pyramimonas_sp.AAC.1
MARSARAKLDFKPAVGPVPGRGVWGRRAAAHGSRVSNCSPRCRRRNDSPMRGFHGTSKMGAALRVMLSALALHIA